MITTYETSKPLEPGKPAIVLEKNEKGHLVGAWIGYWNFKHETVALYPDVRNRFVNWPGGRVPSGRRIVSDRYIKCRMHSAECRNDSTPKEEIKGESWRDRKRPMKGQEAMKF